MNDAAAAPSRRRRLRELRVILLAAPLSLLGLVFAAPALATTYTVTNNGPSSTVPGTLAWAVSAADSDPRPPATINFAATVASPIDLTGTLSLTKDTTIEGPGASKLELDGNGGQVQIMTVSSSATVSISGLRFAFGAVADNGGAIANSGTLTVSDALFDHNHASTAGGGVGQGGAIYNSGTLTVSGSTFTDNAAGGAGASDTTSETGVGLGGAIYTASSGSLRVTGSTFTGNTVGGAGGGGQLSGAGAGGAIAGDTNSSVTVTDSTLTANTAGGVGGSGDFSGQGQGGGLAIASGTTATLEGDTIDANSVGSAPMSLGAGFNNQGGRASFVGTIVSGNTGGAGNCFGGGASVTARDSLEGPAGQTTCGFDLPSANPLLGPLADHGGPTQTQALGAGSPAIGAVSSAGDCLATDQRGASRPRGGCDVGAYEVAPPVVGGASASSVTMTSANLVASVLNPDVFPGTVSFQYGASTAYGSATSAQALAAGSSNSPFGASVSGLAPGTVYHYRVVTTNPDGTTFGPDEQFTTASPPISPPASPPVSPPVSPPPPKPSNMFTFGKAEVALGGKITLPVRAPDAGRFVAKATFTVRRTVITHKHGKRVVKHVTTTFTYGTATVKNNGKGTFKLVVGLSARAAKELKLLGSRQVTIAVTFTPTGGSAHRESKRVLVKRNRKGKYS